MCSDLYGLLEALVLPLQLLSFRQTAGIQHAGGQHHLSFRDPTQHLTQMDGQTGWERLLCVCVCVPTWMKVVPV